MKKRFLCAVLAAVMLLSACDGNAGSTAVAEQEEADVFEALSGLNWDMDYEDVLKALPVPNSKYEDNVRDMAGVSYESVDFFGCDSKLDIYIQSNYGKRQLYRLAFTINTEDISGTYEKLKEMLTEKYGECKQNTEFVSWEFINDNTTVSLSDWDNELICSFVYVRKPLSGYYDTTTAAKKEDLPQEKQPEEKKKLTLQDLSIYEYRKKSLAIPDNEGLPFLHNVTPGDYYTKFLDNNTISLEDVEIKLRESTKGLAEGKDNRDVISKVKSAKMKENCLINSPYIIDTYNPEFKLSVDSDKSMKLEYVKTACVVRPDGKHSNNIVVNGFIRKSGETGVGNAQKCTYQIIIDPAYMYGIPLLTTNREVLNFNINGKDITADTIMLETDSVAMKYVDEASPLKNVSEDFVYGRIELYSINLSYYNTTKTKQEGYYKNSCGLAGVEIYTEDTAAALENPYMISIDKDPEMTAVYNAVINEKDKLLTDDTYGIVLLDMDFDGTPEVLHTKLYPTEDDYGYNWTSDIDIYRVKEGSLKYIDRIYNVHQAVYSVSNLLGIKTLEDGSKAWFSTSYKNRTTGENNVTDYLYTLNGDKLEYTELFTSKPVGEPDEHGNYEYKYYFKGSEIVPTVIKEEVDENDIPMSDTHYEWNGAYSYLGVMWELYGKARERYTSDIEISYKTYSDWLSNIYTKDYNAELEKYTLTDREFSYNIAYLVDEFFLGTYNSAELEYNYYFLGDYAKPVIYLYPEEEAEVSVSLDFTYGGELTCTYPEYKDGWQVTAEPDGTLYDRNGDEYYCLYWEAEGGADFDNSKGFCVKGEDTAKFLREKLMYIGLTAREANEFIIYWLPKMQDNEYNVITLHTADYDRSVPLTVSPAPDTSIRVFMTYYPSEKPVKVQEQVLPHFERTGFTLVEWGGSEY
ncbi:MAG: hypothetical protein ACI4J7_09735 [Ruminiclostridium sp.]